MRIRHSNISLRSLYFSIWNLKKLDNTECLYTLAILGQPHYIGLYTFKDKLNERAADVNFDMSVDPGDALFVNRRYIGVISNFKLADWLFETLLVTVNNSDVSQNIKGICAGDVN